MPFYTPLRYPGGKRRLAHPVARLIETNHLVDVEYVEPYAGGASIALALLFNEYVSKIHINDLSRPVFAFWSSVLDATEALCQRVEATPVTAAEWKRQREIYLRSDDADLFDLGFATFFLNRTNRSGILSGRMIGGMNQTGRWKLDARFSKRELTRRIRKIGRYRTRIAVSQEDAASFIGSLSPVVGPNALFFVDPPYIDAGENLYLNDYSLDDHRQLERQIAELDNHWIVTYDYDAAARHRLHHDRTRVSFALSYSAQHRRLGREAMFLSDSLRLPPEWQDAAEVSIGPPGSKYPVMARVEAIGPFCRDS
ncbi:MAG: DNA adenine methylase [Chloroflexi bacterium]|nr:DNA adenine methylase [Chloroflexota bacterium]